MALAMILMWYGENMWGCGLFLLLKPYPESSIVIILVFLVRWKMDARAVDYF